LNEKTPGKFFRGFFRLSTRTGRGSLSLTGTNHSISTPYRKGAASRAGQFKDIEHLHPIAVFTLETASGIADFRAVEIFLFSDAAFSFHGPLLSVSGRRNYLL
jgi:hypothetical protein